MENVQTKKVQENLKLLKLKRNVWKEIHLLPFLIGMELNKIKNRNWGGTKNYWWFYGNNRIIKNLKKLGYSVEVLNT